MITQPNAVVFPDGRAPTRNLDKFFVTQRTAGQVFVVDPTRRTTLVGRRGTRLTISPNSFSDAAGWPAQENVHLKLREIFSRPEMILAGLTNTSEDRILESAGQLLLEARSGDSELFLTSPIAVDLPLQPGLNNPLASQLFSGGVSQTSSFNSGVRFDWKPANKKSIQLKTLGERKYLHFYVETLNWWNCTSFFRRRRRTMLSVRWSTDDLPVDDLAAFLVFRDFNTVVRMYPGRHGFSSWNIPEDLEARTILLGYSGNKMLVGRSVWAFTSSQPLHIDMRVSAEEDIITMISAWCL